MRTLYPSIDAYHTFTMKVSPLHTLYVEQSGNPTAQPIVFLHGGPGGGIDADNRRYFNPDKWNVTLFDQRGSGKSTPHGSLEENTTWDLVADIEKIRVKLGIEKWHVFGGSWGSTLALAYAVTHPERVAGLILRGIFLLSKQEINWFYQYGASELFPDLWESFIAPIPANERGDLLTAYHNRLTAPEQGTLIEVAKAWSIWEGSTATLLPSPDFVSKFGGDAFAYAFARIESHYFAHGGFFAEDGWLLKQVHKLADIEGIIVQGRYDMPCPVRSAWELHKRWPRSKLEIIPDAGHAASQPGTTDALIRATDFFMDRN